MSTSVPLVLERVTVCGAGDCPPTGAENESADGKVTSMGVAATVRVTGMDSGLFTAGTPVDAMMAVMLMDPLQVPAERPAVAMETDTAPSVTPVMGLVELFNSSQLLPHVVAVVEAV